MKTFVLIGLLHWLGSYCLAQPRAVYSPAQAHAHNDYEHTIPFQQAYDQQFGSIEADIYARNGQLYVAHDSADITPARTLDALYLQPILEKVRVNKGVIYANVDYRLQWLIDLKTPAVQSLPMLVNVLSTYPAVFGPGGPVQVVVSGNVPAPAQFQQYPDWLKFDGRPTLVYTPDQLTHVGLISQDFTKYSRWNGQGPLFKHERAAIQLVVDQAHRQGKKFRFWATPDTIDAWKLLIDLGVDYINTDNLTGLGQFLRTHPTADH